MFSELRDIEIILIQSSSLFHMLSTFRVKFVWANKDLVRYFRFLKIEIVTF